MPTRFRLPRALWTKLAPICLVCLVCLVCAGAGSASAAGDEPGAPDAKVPRGAAAASPGVASSARVALLGAAGPVALTRPLDAELASALSAKRRAGARALPQVISSRALADRLRADPATRQHLAAAAAALGSADKAALYMKRGGAVSAARQAIAELDEAQARFVAPAKLARAHAALAYALLLAPADEVGARDALRAAVTADPTFAPDSDRQNPTVKRLLADARAKRRVAPPDSAALDKLAARARLERLVWLHVTPLAATASEPAARSVELQVLVYQVSARAVRTNLRKRVPRAKLVSAAADLVEQALLGDTALAGGAGAKPDGSGSSGGGAAAKASRPWYKRWWVWAIAGAVVAGAGVGLGVGLTRGDSNTTPPPNPNGFDIEFRH